MSRRGARFGQPLLLQLPSAFRSATQCIYTLLPLIICIDSFAPVHAHMLHLGPPVLRAPKPIFPQ